MAHPDEAFPFPFFGAGEAGYYMWAEVHVRFGRQPTTSQRAVIEDTVPPPLRGSVSWCGGRQLMVASGLFLHGALVRTYPLAAGENDRIGDDGWLYAAPSRVAALNAAIESWLLDIHRECPVLAAYRAEDPDGGGTRLSAWHDWSLGRLPELLPELEPLLEEGGHATSMARGVLAMARRAGNLQGLGVFAGNMLSWSDGPA
ncbi:hypothetical protein FHS43_002439 [Streptosporangium becharense]|uniref:Uncharacterized protein n=1 Tax=Streptosporangium becharense TaxID=1816182 RepID=A0A7W9IKH8_9ACTN|nr:hypothetical protein [Streptosporangium becharense]MBB2911174.1 hypothetical protein [Streptosporangium becharense]MBB5821768.1 hypothetical protein [Streptosporangium becharense]